MKLPDNDIELATRWLADDNRNRRYVFGRNEDSERLISVFPSAAVIDDFAADGAEWKAHRVVKSADVPVDALVANCISSIRPVEGEERLKRFGITLIFPLSAVHEVAPDYN